MSAQTPIWVQILIGLISSGSIATLIQLGRQVLRRRASKRYDQGYGDISRIYELIQGLLSETDANRVVVMISENGGGIPAPGCQVKSSIRYEVVDSPAKPMLSSWQVVPLDQDYASRLAAVNTEGRATLLASDLHKGTWTHELIAASDATHCYMFRICATAHALLYLSVQYSSPSDDAMSVDDQAAARGVLVKLGTIFSKHHQLIKREPQP